ncbi:MAG: excinuclease ABC subunit UvrC [Bdellovibrionales bacterium]|nr:excinuclease ABC subunit UvrC [Bdellovibrionales bacterium]
MMSRSLEVDKNIAQQVSRAPSCPGVYLFKDHLQRILYVGKAIKLKERVKSYLHPEADLRPSIPLLMKKARLVEWIVTDNEKEALILENNLIKTYRPRYNIMLKDDKSYVSLKLSSHSFPRLHITRKIKQDGSRYYGPFSSGRAVRKTFKFLQKLYLLRDCTDYFYNSRTRPCLRYQIKRCSAPCVDLVKKEEYMEQVLQVDHFLKGKKMDVVQSLHEKMKQASLELDYEKAAMIRDELFSIEETLRPQNVESIKTHDQSHVIGHFGDEEACLIKILKIVQGKIIGFEDFFVEEPVQIIEDIYSAVLKQYYLEDLIHSKIPTQMILESSFTDQETFLEVIKERNGKKPKLLFPQKGEKYRLLQLANRNAQSSFAEKKRKSQQTLSVLTQLQKKLHLKNLPKRIEGYDISNIQGKYSFGSQVVFIEGEKDSSQYRIYSIKSVQGPDDFSSMREVLTRRLQKLDEINYPDLLLIDGGKGQLKQAVEVLKELNLSDIDVCSLAKEKTLVSRSGKKYAPERVFLPGQSNAIVFEPSSSLLHMLMRVRDEAHRFGLKHHRKKRSSMTIGSVLSEIPGIGPKKRKILLRSMGSFEKIRRATIEELLETTKLDKKSVQAVFEYCRKMDEQDSSEEE